MFKVEWTGSYPCLCHGEWKIYKNGRDVSECIPQEKRGEPMNTYNEYSRWYFTDDWDEETEYYYDGLEVEDWIENNSWINKICDAKTEKEELYKAINNEDWREGSCGGCI